MTTNNATQDTSSAGDINNIAARAKNELRKQINSARHHASRAAATVTLREFRTETELALSELVQVMCAHEAEIAELRRQLAATIEGNR